MTGQASKWLAVLGLALSLGGAACSDSKRTGGMDSPELRAGSGGAADGGNAGSSAGKAGSAGKGAAGSGSTSTASVEDYSCPVVVKDEDCNKDRLPVVFVHGTYGSGDNIANVAELFGSNGYCQDRFVAVEYNSLGSSPMDLDALIDSIRTKTGKDQVELMGHSQGTAHCVNYLGDAAHAAKVAHYVNLSGAAMVPNDVKTLSLSSMNDIGGSPHHAPNAEKQVTFEEADHFAVAASKEAFVAIWNYLYGEDPKYTTIQCGADPVTLEGIAESFADNTPVQGGQLAIYEVGKTPRENGDPIMTLTGDEKGHVGPIQLKRGVQYEFKALDAQGKTLGWVYFSPFKRSNRLARFLSPSSNPLVVGMTSGKVKIGPGNTAMVMRYYGGAFRPDLMNSLKVDGNEVLSADNSPRNSPTVGLFMSDQNDNQMSDLGSIFSAPFIVGTDVYIDATKPAWVELEWTADNHTTKMKVPNWPSSEGFDSVTVP
jgi:pimeloyl-ACP methyl ester carboxylesterase